MRYGRLLRAAALLLGACGFGFALISSAASSRPLLLCAALLAMISALISLAAEARTENALAELAKSVRSSKGESGTDGETVTALGFAIDRLQDDLQRALDGLASERDRLGAILEGMVESVVVTGADGKIALANRAFRELTAKQEWRGRLPLEVLRSDVFSEALERAAQGERVTREIPLHAPERLLIAHAAPLPIREAERATGERGGAVCVLHDITELRRLETIRRDFVTNVSHELRTPITALRGYAETLLDGALDDPKNARRFVETIHRHAERLTRLVSDLLSLAALDAHRVETKPRPVALAAIETSTRQLVAEQAKQRKLQIDGSLAGCVVLGDPDWIEQVVINLVDNAVKYTFEGGTISLRFERSGNTVRVEVKNSGPEIEPHHLPRLFERFYRIDAGRARAQGGTGLGLAIVKHLIEAMNGEVGCDTGTGDGVTFWFTLPAAELDAPGLATSSPAVGD